METTNHPAMSSFSQPYLNEYEPYASTSRLPVADPFIPRQMPQTRGPITLTWNPSDLEGDSHSTPAQLQLDPTFENAIPVILPPRSPSPIERPPEYATAQRPTTDIHYTFSPIGHNAMVLLPSADAQDTRPQYYITVNMNVFMPLSHITTIYRGATEYGEVVGEFEMGIIIAPTRLQFKNNKVASIDSVISKTGSRDSGTWKYIYPGLPKKTNLVWDYLSRPCVCRAIVGSTVLARFRSNQGHDHRRPKISELEVTPAGQEFFDHIILSLFVIERKRLTPEKRPSPFNA